MRKLMAVLTVILIFLSTTLFAETGDGLPVAKTKVRTLAAFKNGLSFVFRSGVAPLKDGWTVLEEIPPASMGALWIGTGTPNARVDEVVSYKGRILSENDALNIGDLLEVSVGSTITLYWQAGPVSAVEKMTGKIISVPKFNRIDSHDGQSYNPGYIVIIETTNGNTVTINKNLIQYIEITGTGKMQTKINRDVTSAKAHVTGDVKSADLTMTYLSKGVTWNPSYLVNIHNKKEADITLEAVLANDTEDLENTEVSFVVGYPNFKFADVITPINALQSVSAFIQSLTNPQANRNQGYRGYPEAIMAQSVLSNYAAYDSVQPSAVWNPDTTYSAANLPGESNEDLFFYKQQNVTLKKGERGRYTVFSVKVPYTHQYQWDVPDMRGIDEMGRMQSVDASKKPEDQVWHVLKIENTSPTPWTTASAFVVNGAMPVAQDVLKYTPPKGSNTLRLTVATDVLAEQTQTEVLRKSITNGVYADYDVIEVEGILTIKSMKSDEISMIVNKYIMGTVTNADSYGKVERNAARLSAVNPQSKVSWNFQLAPGVEKKLTYHYKTYIHR